MISLLPSKLVTSRTLSICFDNSSPWEVCIHEWVNQYRTLTRTEAVEWNSLWNSFGISRLGKDTLILFWNLIFLKNILPKMRFQKCLPLLSDTSTFLKWNSWTKVHYFGIYWIWIFLPTIFLVKPITLKITINLIFLALVLWVREIYAKRFEKSIFHFSNQIVASYTSLKFCLIFE